MTAMFQQLKYAFVFFLFVVLLVADAKKKLPKSSTHNKKPETRGDNGEVGEWVDWKHAFDLADSDENGKLHVSDIPALFKEHFNKAFSAVPHHSGADRVTREVEDVFLDEAEAFEKHVRLMGTPDTHEFDFKEFKQMLTMFMHARADIEGLLNRAQDL